MIKYYCDKCGKEIDTDEIYLVRVEGLNRENVFKHNLSEVQLCKECAENIKKVSVEFYPVAQINHYDKETEQSILSKNYENFLFTMKNIDCINLKSTNSRFIPENEKNLIKAGLNIIQSVCNLFDKYGVTKEIPKALQEHKERMKKENWTFKEWK